MRTFLERLGTVWPAAVALALPTVFIPNLSPLPSAVDEFILPRASIVIGAACVGAGLALLTPGGPSLSSLRLPVIASALAALLAFAFSVSWPLSFAGSYTRYESLPMRLGYLGLLASTVWLSRRRRARDLIAPAFVFGTAVACLEALLQSAGKAPFRPDGNLGNANLLAGLISLALPLALARGLGLVYSIVAAPHVAANRGRRLVYAALAWWLSIPVLAVGLLVSTSRSGALGALAGCLALGAFAIRRRFAANNGLVAGAVLAACGLVGLAVAAIVATPLSRLNDDPPGLRLHLWQDGIRMVAARPLTGWGEDTTGIVFGQFLSHDYASLVTFDRIHSGPLDIAATEGILGLAALSWVLVTLFRGAWQFRFPGDAAGLVAALVGYSVWVAFNFDWAPATGAFWLLAGTAWSYVREADSESGTTPAVASSVARAGWRRSMLAVAFGLAAMALAAMPVLADFWYYGGRADLSVKVDPLQSRYHWSLGEALVARGSVAQGVGEMRLAADFGESEPSLYVELGDAEATLGHTSQARADYRRALAIDPYYTPASERLGALK